MRWITGVYTPSVFTTVITVPSFYEGKKLAQTIKLSNTTKLRHTINKKFETFRYSGQAKLASTQLSFLNSIVGGYIQTPLWFRNDEN